MLSVFITFWFIGHYSAVCFCSKSLQPISLICQYVPGGNLRNHGSLCAKKLSSPCFEYAVSASHRSIAVVQGPWVDWVLPEGPWNNTANTGETETKVSACKMGLT